MLAICLLSIWVMPIGGSLCRHLRPIMRVLSFLVACALALEQNVTSSGNRKRTMTIREAIVDEQDGGSFLADMTDIEFAKYQQLIWQAETPKKLNQAKLGGGSS